MKIVCCPLDNLGIILGQLGHILVASGEQTSKLLNAVQMETKLWRLGSEVKELSACWEREPNKATPFENHIPLVKDQLQVFLQRELFSNGSAY